MDLKFIYTIIIGVFFAILVGVGIDTFYPAPKYPEYPRELQYGSPDANPEYMKKQQEFDNYQVTFQKTRQTYQKYVSLITIVVALLTIIASFTLLRRIPLISEGFLLGGTFTLFYSMIQGFGSEDPLFRFLVVSIGFMTTLSISYLKFIKRPKK